MLTPLKVKPDLLVVVDQSRLDGIRARTGKHARWRFFRGELRVKSALFRFAEASPLMAQLSET